MLSIGTDSTKFPGAAQHNAFWLIEQASSIELDGVFFRSVFELSPQLDATELRDVAQAAADLGMRIEAGVAKVNPFATPESPEIRDLGGGDFLAGMTAMITAAAKVGITELWTATANYQFRLPGLYACDRFRTDVSWESQLAATTSFLHRLAPVLRGTGVHLNIETHEEITSFETVRLVEDVGPDVLGITFDTANVLVRCEDPVAAATRVAPYVKSTHIRDAALSFTTEGISRFLVPVGDGVINWPALLALLNGKDVMLSIEGITRSRAEMALFIHDPIWQHAHPDLTVPEVLEVIRLTQDYELRASAGLAPNADKLRESPGPETPLDFITLSAARLRKHLDDLPDAKTLERT